jgi:hypothetical protein
MISLPNGCGRSEIICLPDNWHIDPETIKEKDRERTINDLLKKEWRVVYRYYDPAFKVTKLWGKQFPTKGMNKYKTLKERQEYAQSIIDELKTALDQECYNLKQLQYDLTVWD